jgi:hypothetical protein
VHEEIPNDLERNDARPNPIQAKTVCLRRSGFFPLKGGFALDFLDSLS